ncbi:MAG: hypothetical protein IH631_10765, partial [Candidatus Thorarchaeota archaeon]|nr:hypothetical protein [Candidatus Thorarchaeota archaeon]
AETDAADEESLTDDAEYETVVEEVMVDEDGQIIENLDDYEIIEVVEEVFDEEEEEEGIVVEVQIEEEEEEEAELIVEEILSTDEEIEINVIEPKEIEETVPVEIEFSDADVAHDEIEVIELAALDDLTDSTEKPIDASIDVESDEPIDMVSDFDEIFATAEDTHGPKVVVVPNDHDVRMAKEIIFEALEADDIISAEIDKVPHEDLDGALEAFGSNEALLTDEEEEGPLEDIDAESLVELESILGPLDKYIGDSEVDNERKDDEKEHLPIDNESLKELSDLLDFVESNEDEY